MRRINLEAYMEKVVNEEGKEVELPYDVRNSMIEVLLSRELQLTATEVLDRYSLACRIRDSSDGTILLEEADYSKLKTAIDTIRGWCRTDVEFLRRITEAEKVEVKEV